MFLMLDSYGNHFGRADCWFWMVLGLKLIEITPLKINMPPDKGPFQKENSLPPITFSWDMLDFGG